MPKRITAAVAALAILATPALAQDEPETTADTVVAIVNGEEITVGHMIVARQRLPQQYQQLPDEMLFPGILDQLIQQAAMATGEVDLSKRSELLLENERRALISGQIMATALEEALTPEAIEGAYQSDYVEKGPEKEFNAAHILVETEEEAQAIVAELEGGADFTNLAREKSTGPSGPNGGELGWFSKGMMVPEFETAVMNLEPEAISAPVETQFGWHVIKLNETRDMEVPELLEVREQIVADIQRQTMEALLGSATDGAEVERSEDGIDPSVLSNPDLLEN